MYIGYGGRLINENGSLNLLTCEELRVMVVGGVPVSIVVRDFSLSDIYSFEIYRDPESDIDKFGRILYNILIQSNWDVFRRTLNDDYDEDLSGVRAIRDNVLSLLTKMHGLFVEHTVYFETMHCIDGWLNNGASCTGYRWSIK